MIALELPNRRCYDSYMEAVREYREHHVTTYEFANLPERDLFEFFENFRDGKNLPESYVSATYLWLTDENEFIGEVSIRHELTESLHRLGGHIGYGVRFSKWGRGYASVMLCMALEYARTRLGLRRCLITCNDDNYASAVVIEKNGGLLQDIIIDQSGTKKRKTRRYWVELQ